MAAARQRQQARFGSDAAIPLNAALEPEETDRHCPLDRAGRSLLDAASERLGLSPRAVHRILKVARTIADLAQHAGITAADVAEAIQYRSLDRKVVM